MTDPAPRLSSGPLPSARSDRHGAIDPEWDADANILTSRVVTRGRGKPNLIIGDFVDFPASLRFAGAAPDRER